MKLQLPVPAAVVSLAACIPVEDFGAYWQKTDIDKRLEGSWKRVPASPYQTRDGGYGIGSLSTFVRKGGIPDDDTHWLCDERFERVP